MPQVFYVQSITDDTPITFGETDGKLVDGEYLKVGNQLIHSAFTFLNTPENLALLKGLREEYATWRALEPNLYAVLNQMQRPKRDR